MVYCLIRVLSRYSISLSTRSQRKAPGENGTMKARTLIPLALLAVACGSSSTDKGQTGLGGAAKGGTGGSSSETGGTSSIVVMGGTTGTGTGGTDGTTGGSSGNGTISMETAADLRNQSCAGSSTEPELLPVVLMLVVDTSLSMNDRPNGAQNTKWEITRDALGRAVESLPSTAAVGVLYFPNMNTSGSMTARPIDQCVNINAMIPISVLGDAGSGPRNTIATSLTDTRPNGSTPTHDAYDYAYTNGMQASKLTGNRFMLLITDGAPTLKKGCQGGGMPNDAQPTQPIIDDILAARQAGVRTFIIGSPGSESVNNVDVRPWLATAAVAGGTASEGCSVLPAMSGGTTDWCHIDLSQGTDFAGALNAALSRILGLITSCTFDVPATGADGQVVNKSEVNVIYTPGTGGDDVLIGRDDSPNCQDGWQFDAEGRVVLCPNTCSTAQNDPMGKLELLFGCSSVNVNPVK
jgi:Mg-chelatase subunit ChlD